MAYSTVIFPIKRTLALLVLMNTAFLSNAEDKKSFSYTSTPKLDEGTLSEVMVPLFHSNGHIWSKDVPAKLFGPAREGVFRAMCSPVYATSSEGDERKRDINLISICRIEIALKSGSKKDGNVLVFDLSGSVEPKELGVSLANVVQATIACIRIQFPPKDLGEVTLRVTGGPTGTNWSQFEGSLWQ